VSKDQKVEKIMKFIEEQAAEANKNMKDFTDFFSTICQ